MKKKAFILPMITVVFTVLSCLTVFAADLLSEDAIDAPESFAEPGLNEDFAEADTEDDIEDDIEDDVKDGARSGAPKAQFAPPLPVPKLTGNWRRDFISVARSQLGYKEASDGSSFFGDWLDQTYRPWCSEFASWCAYTAGVPEDVLRPARSSKRFIEFLAPQNRYFYVEGGIDSANTDFMKEYSFTNIRTIKPSEIQTGDIILWESNGDINDGPDHTAIFLRQQGGEIEYISGNSNDTVNIRTRNVSRLHGVCRPDFDKCTVSYPDVPKISKVECTKNGLKVKWNKVKNATGYVLERSRDGKRFYVMSVINSADKTEYKDDKAGRNGVFFRYRIRAFNDDNGEKYTGRNSSLKATYRLIRADVKSVKNKTKRSLTVRWKKNSKGSGYEIQYSTKKSFKNAKTVTIKSAKTTSRKISNLKKNKKYFVRVRPYKKVNKKKYYGAWAEFGKGVKIKK